MKVVNEIICTVPAFYVWFAAPIPFLDGALHPLLDAFYAVVFIIVKGIGATLSSLASRWLLETYKTWSLKRQVRQLEKKDKNVRT